MTLSATDNRKNIVAPQVSGLPLPPPKKTLKMRFLGENDPLQKITVSYMVPNFGDQEPKTEGPRRE